MISQFAKGTQNINVSAIKEQIGLEVEKISQQGGLDAYTFLKNLREGLTEDVTNNPKPVQVISQYIIDYIDQIYLK